MNYTKLKKYLNLSTLAIFVAVIIFVGSAWAIWDRQPKVVYQPTDACKLLTVDIAKSLLGEKVIGIDTSGPKVEGSIAGSKCSYTDSNPTQDLMKVAAVAVRSGVNDDGDKQNKTDFTTKKQNDSMKKVDGIGQEAFFDLQTGQLNILDGHRWIILSYGVGSSPQGNSLDDAVKFAHKILK